MLLNTSFNVHEEPIVAKPEESAKTLTDGCVEFVVTCNAVYAKGGGEDGSQENAISYSEYKTI